MATSKPLAPYWPSMAGLYKSGLASVCERCIIGQPPLALHCTGALSSGVSLIICTHESKRPSNLTLCCYFQFQSQQSIIRAWNCRWPWIVFRPLFTGPYRGSLAVGPITAPGTPVNQVALEARHPFLSFRQVQSNKSGETQKVNKYTLSFAEQRFKYYIYRILRTL